MNPPKTPTPVPTHNPSLKSLHPRLLAALRRHNALAPALKGLQAENADLDPRARHTPPETDKEVPSLAAMEARGKDAAFWVRELEAVEMGVGAMEREMEALRVENERLLDEYVEVEEEEWRGKDSQ